MPVATGAQFTLQSLDTEIPRIFTAAAASTANHTKGASALYQLLSNAALVQKPGNPTAGEYAFGDIFFQMVGQVLCVDAKGSEAVSNITAFVATFLLYVAQKEEEERVQDRVMNETFGSLFIDRFLRTLTNTQLLTASKKLLRHRALHMTTRIIQGKVPIDEEFFPDLRRRLMTCLSDKEYTIRVLAATALSQLMQAQDVDRFIPAEEQSIEKVLMGSLACDPSSEVRKTIAKKLPITPDTIDNILERTFEDSPFVRKAVFGRLLDDIFLNPKSEPRERGPAHPHGISKMQRGSIVWHGLGDREKPVRDATSKLLGGWLDALREPKAEEGNEQSDMDLLIAFVQLFDLKQKTSAEDALFSIFKSHPGIFNKTDFPRAYWENRTVEKAFLARAFSQYCRKEKMEQHLEDALPSPAATFVALQIQKSYNLLMDRVDDMNRLDDERDELRCILAELMPLALNLDYSDLAGRRRLHQLLTQMIAGTYFPLDLGPIAVKLLFQVCEDEQDLLKVVEAAVNHLLGEVPNGADQEAVRARCFDLMIAMLQCLNGVYENHPKLEFFLKDFIIPAVNANDTPSRVEGMIGLGLYCLLDKSRASSAFNMMVAEMQTPEYPEDLKITVLQALFDMVVAYDVVFLAGGEEKVVELGLENLLLNLLRDTDFPKVMTVVSGGFCKISLSGQEASPKLIHSLLRVYFDPSTAKNPELRQGLAVFFPAYCSMSPASAQLLRQEFIPIFIEISNLRKEQDEDLIPPAAREIISPFVEWTDPSRAGNQNQLRPDDTIQVDMAEDILRSLFSEVQDASDKLALCQHLIVLHIPDQVEDDKLHRLKLLIDNLRSRRPLQAKAAHLLTNFDKMLLARFKAQLANFSEVEFRTLGKLIEAFQFVELFPAVEPEEEEKKPSVSTSTQTKEGNTTTRRSDSIKTEGEGPGNSATPAPKPRSQKGPLKKRRVSQNDEDGSSRIGSASNSGSSNTDVNVLSDSELSALSGEE